MAAAVSVARYLLNEASSGTAPANCADDTGNGNVLVCDYTNNVAWTSNAQGNGVDFSTAAGQAGGGRLHRTTLAGNLGASFPAGTKELSALFLVEVDDTHSFGCRVINLGASNSNCEFAAFQITTTFNFTWGYDSGNGGVAKFPALNGQGLHLVSVKINTAEANAADRIKVKYNNVPQTASSNTIAQDSTINLNLASRYICLGGRYDSTRALDGRLYYCEIFSGILTDAQETEAYTNLSADNDSNWLTQVVATLDDINTTDGKAIITGTCNIDHSDIELYINDGGTEDFYRYKSLSGKFEIPTYPEQIDPKVVRLSDDVSVLNDSYIAYPQTYRLTNNNILLIYSVGPDHANNLNRWCGKISTDEGKTFGAEFTIYDHPSNFCTQGAGGGIDPVDGRPYLIFWYYDPAGKGRAQRHIVRGDADGTNFTFLKEVNTSFDWSDTNLVDGHPFYQYFGGFVQIGTKTFQLAYGRTRAWLFEWDSVGKDLINKQLLFDNNSTHAGGNEADAVNNMGEIIIVPIDDTLPARCVFYLRDQKNLDSFASFRGTIDASGNFTIDATYGQPESNITQWTTTEITAGCTIRGMRIEDDVILSWGARLNVGEIICTRTNKEAIWNDPGFGVRENENNNRKTAYVMNPNAAGQGLDTGMPWLLVMLDASGNPIYYTYILVFYDQNNVGDNTEASVYLCTGPRLDVI